MNKSKNYYNKNHFSKKNKTSDILIGVLVPACILAIIFIIIISIVCFKKLSCCQKILAGRKSKY